MKDLIYSDLVKYFLNACENNIRLQFQLEDKNKLHVMKDEYVTRYVKQVFAYRDGNLQGLGLGTSNTDSRWEYCHWNESVKFGYASEDQIVGDKEFVDGEDV